MIAINALIRRVEFRLDELLDLRDGEEQVSKGISRHYCASICLILVREWTGGLGTAWTEQRSTHASMPRPDQRRWRHSCPNAMLQRPVTRLAIDRSLTIVIGVAMCRLQTRLTWREDLGCCRCKMSYWLGRILDTSKPGNRSLPLTVRSFRWCVLETRKREYYVNETSAKRTLLPEFCWFHAEILLYSKHLREWLKQNIRISH